MEWFVEKFTDIGGGLNPLRMRGGGGGVWVQLPTTFRFSLYLSNPAPTRT